MKGSIDRIEEEFAVCVLDDESVININISDLDFTPKEKDVIEKVNEKWVKLEEETNSRKKEIENILDSMWEN